VRHCCWCLWVIAGAGLQSWRPLLARLVKSTTNTNCPMVQAESGLLMLLAMCT
jgi:hypothetical protein